MSIHLSPLCRRSLSSRAQYIASPVPPHKGYMYSMRDIDAYWMNCECTASRHAITTMGVWGREHQSWCCLHLLRLGLKACTWV